MKKKERKKERRHGREGRIVNGPKHFIYFGNGLRLNLKFSVNESAKPKRLVNGPSESDCKRTNGKGEYREEVELSLKGRRRRAKT